MNRGALAGVRIADFTWTWAGPFATTLLGLMGAEVIKIESHHRIDYTRQGSFTTTQDFSGVDQSTVFNDINQNKLSISLNLSQPKAIELAKRIVSISDVAIENMRPGVMERLGLGYQTLREVKPNIIMLSSSACGARGPERHYVGYAPTFGALGGLSYLTGYPEGTPTWLAGPMDLRSAVTTAYAILAALYHLRKTGRGQHIDFSSREAISALIGDVLLDYEMNGRVQSRQGNRHPFMAPHNCYRCQGVDKWVSIAVATDDEWRALCRAMGHPEWDTEARFANALSRWQNQDELDRLIASWTAERTHYEVMERLQGVGVAAAPSFNGNELYHDPHAQERGMFVTLHHPVIGERVVVAPPWKMDTAARIERPAPLLGQHNDYIFIELLGMSPEEVAWLKEEGAVS
jgi:crotonobetainyl-CoA:carnitine CoA-transferase CaiB-like acyl-CoA transferase